MEYSVSLNGKFLKKGQMVGSMPEIPAELKVNPEDEIISGQWTNSEEMLQKLFFFTAWTSANARRKIRFF